jgi:kynureninase
MSENFKKQVDELDKADPLRAFKELFELDEHVIYLDGNSLGPLPKKTGILIQELVQEQWGKRLIRSWNEDWLVSQKRIANKIAKLIHAEENEVLISDSVSANLYKLAFAALKAQNGKNKILTDDLNFPSDLYIFQGLIEQSFPVKVLETIPQKDLEKANEQILTAISAETALVSLSHVTYKGAFQYDVKSINEKAKSNGALNLWDLSHAVGAVHIDVKSMQIDMAVGCTYKYLNGGPGAPSFLYVSKALQNSLVNPIAGWFSHTNPFEFNPDFVTSNTIQRFAVGTPPVLSLKAIEPGIDIFLDAGMKNIHFKSVELFELFFQLFQYFLKEINFNIETPITAASRGSHIALTHDEAYRINLSLINPRIDRKTIITDHRPPNNIRIALTPLYLSFGELYETVLRLKEIVDTKEFENHSPVKTGVI